MTTEQQMISVLWNIAQAPRSYVENGKTAVILVEQHLLDKIDDLIGYDEMGG